MKEKKRLLRKQVKNHHAVTASQNNIRGSNIKCIISKSDLYSHIPSVRAEGVGNNPDPNDPPPKPLGRVSSVNSVRHKKAYNKTRKIAYHKKRR